MGNYYNSEWYQNLSDSIGEEYTGWDNLTKKQKRNAVKQEIEREAKVAATNPKWTNPYNLTQKQFSALGVSVNQSAINAANWGRQRFGDYYNNVPENDREWFKTVENEEIPKFLKGETTKARDNYFSKDMPERVESMRKRLQKQAKYINEGGTNKYGPSYSLETFKKAGIDINEDNYNKAVEYRNSFKSNRAWQNSSAQRNTRSETNSQNNNENSHGRISVIEKSPERVESSKYIASNIEREKVIDMVEGVDYTTNSSEPPRLETRNRKGNNALPAIVSQTQNADKSGGNKESPPSKRSRWKKAGYIGVGMAVLGAAGLAVNSLMINDKGRLNNAQMYGQQPYSQY